MNNGINEIARFLRGQGLEEEEVAERIDEIIMRPSVFEHQFTVANASTLDFNLGTDSRISDADTHAVLFIIEAAGLVLTIAKSLGHITEAALLDTMRTIQLLGGRLLAISEKIDQGEAPDLNIEDIVPAVDQPFMPNWRAAGLSEAEIQLQHLMKLNKYESALIFMGWLIRLPNALTDIEEYKAELENHSVSEGEE